MACGERLLKKPAQAERALGKLKEIRALESSLEKEILYEVASKRLRNQVVHIYNFSMAEYVFSLIKEEVIPVFDHIVMNLREFCKE